MLLGVVRSASISDALLESLNNTVLGLGPILPPASKLQHAQDNQLLLSCFALQLMLLTITAPLQQTSEFHRSPDFNVETSQEHHSNRQSHIWTRLVQNIMQWLHTLQADTPTKLKVLLETIRLPRADSKLPDVDDASFLDPTGLEVHACTLLLTTHT